MKNRFDKHHRKPRSIGGSNKPSNISHIPHHFHQAWHLLFANFTAEQIAQRITDWYLDSDYLMLAVRREQ